MNEEKKHPGVIYLSDLAQQYFPDSTPRSAVSQLHRWIALNTELTRRLEELLPPPPPAAVCSSASR